jgi:hypothetical protein
MGEKKGLFLVFAVLLFILNMLLIRQTFSFSREVFLFEFFLVLFLGMMSLDSMNEFTKKNFSCFSVFAIYFGLLLLNSVGLKIFAGVHMSLSILFLSGFGFLISTSNISSRRDECCGTFKDVEQKVMDDIVKSKEKSEPITPSYSQKKYIASKIGKKYHTPKCDFAKKIPKRNQVWISSKDEAEEKGYKPCKCV